MTDEQVTPAVQRESVGAARSAVQMRKYADLGNQSTCGEWHSPDLICPGNCDEQKSFFLIHYDAVWTGNRVHEAGELAVRCQLPYPTCRVVHAGLSLICEVKIARSSEDQIVYALEAFAGCGLKKWGYSSAAWVQQHDP